MSTSGAKAGQAFNFNFSFVDSADPTSFYTTQLQTSEVNVYQRNGAALSGPVAITTQPAVSGSIHTISLLSGEMVGPDEVVLEFSGTGFVSENVSISLEAADADVVAVTGTSVTDVNDFKATGFNTVAPDNASIADILADTNELQLNQGNWLTATGFSTHSQGDVVTAMQAVAGDFKADVSGLSTFDSTVDPVIVGDKTGYTLTQAFPSNFADLIIGTGADLGKVTTSNPAAGSGSAHTAQDVADLILVTPANKLATDVSGNVEANNMRGTDNAALATSVASLPTAADNADAVWDEQYSQHTAAGTFGKLIDIFRKATTSTEGTVSGTPTTTAFDTNLTMTNDNFNDQLVVFTSGSLIGVSAPIADTAATNGRITLQEPLPAAPSVSDEFIILSDHIHPVSEIQSGLASQSSVDTVSSNVDTLVSNQGDITITTAQAQAIADEVLSRSVGNVEGASLDEHSLATVVLAILESQRVGSTWTIYRTDGTTTQATKALTLDSAAQPVTRVQ